MRDILKRMLCPAVILTFPQYVAEERTDWAWNLLKYGESRPDCSFSTFALASLIASEFSLIPRGPRAACRLIYLVFGQVTSGYLPLV